MSLGGRYVIDRIKRSVGKYVRLPVPPYNNPNFWEGVYKKMAPTDVFEWGDFDCEDLMEYSCRRQRYDMKRLMFLASQNDLGQASVTGKNLELTQSGLAEALGIAPAADGETTTKEEPILMLGCGNSMLGPDMLTQGWRGPIIGVDVSSRVIHDLSRRYVNQQYNMRFLQDDATFLSAIEDETVAAVVDKGMVDAVFCTEDYDTCHAVLRSVNRVMHHGGIFCCFSFSRPEFILQKLLFPDAIPTRGMRSHEQQMTKEWSAVEIQRLGFIYLYRFFKVSRSAANVRLPKTASNSRQHRRAKY